MTVKNIIIAAIVGLMAYFTWTTFSQPGVSDLEGDFKEDAFLRNENNTGPVVRVYAVSVSDTLWAAMEQYGKMMPHNKYGNTKVYFFEKGEAPNDLKLEDDNFDRVYQASCLARFEKDAMGKEVFTRYPFK
ncbi:hypothetical protein V6R21_21695 [Limibacter armeniacum]|uniref:hypothetical protein n=1 Tax=Limibacter armeniacum TaxID=466084 RepID=UPI002FE51303